MKTIIGLGLILVLTACSSGGGDAVVTDKSASQNDMNIGSPPPPRPTPTPTPSPIDYGKVTCGTEQSCADACDFAYPYTDETTIRQNICQQASITTPNSSLCNGIVEFHASEFISMNSWCKSLKVTDVIEVRSINFKSCSENSNCNEHCTNGTRFQAEEDKAILRQAAANGSLKSGATLKELVRNQVVRELQAACYDAPANFISPAIF